MDKGSINYEEMIQEPTPLSSHILAIAQEGQDRFSFLLEQSFIRKVTLHLYYRTKYREIYSFVEGFNPAQLPGTIEGHFDSLREIFEMIALNNILLSYAFLTQNPTNHILTREDEKLKAMADYSHKRLTKEDFDNRYGHYALNAYELSSRRFSEYSDDELMALVRVLDDFTPAKTETLQDHMSRKRPSLYAIYCTLREELKHIALLVIRNLRFMFLDIQKRYKIEDIFSMEYNEIQRTLIGPGK